jgi:hypothetical protein
MRADWEETRNKSHGISVYLHVRFARALLFLIPLAAAFGQQRSYSFTGQLVFDNGLPVANAEIEVTTTAWQEVADPVLTDAQGRFAFTGLPEGTFIVAAHRNDLGTFHWGQRPQSWLMSAVNLNEKFPHQEIVFRIERFGTVVGTVRDAAGNPLPNMLVSAARRSWGNGKAAMQTNGNAMTDDLGRFRIPSVTRGRYRICATSTQGSAPAPPLGYATFGQNSPQVYAETCQPEAGSRDLVEITQGKKVEVDLVLSPQSLVEVSGRVTNLPEGQVVMVQLQPVEQAAGTRNYFGQVTGEGHTFQIANVLRGRYWASAQASRSDNGVQTPVAARVPVTVGNSPVGDVEVTLEALPAVDVVVHAPSDAGAISVGLRDADEPLGVATDAQRQTDGSLRIALQHSGRYWLVTRTLLCPTAARLGKADALDHALEIAPGTKGTLEVSFSDHCGEIGATVIDQAGKPVPKARILILISGTLEDPGDLDLGTAGDDGVMSYNGMTPGKYSLWAWNEADEWNGDIEDLAALKTRQTVVEIGAGEKAKVQVPLLNSFRQGNQ